MQSMRVHETGLKPAEIGSKPLEAGVELSKQAVFPHIGNRAAFTSAVRRNPLGDRGLLTAADGIQLSGANLPASVIRSRLPSQTSRLKTLVAQTATPEIFEKSFLMHWYA